jgi:hypothetical protein
MDQSRKAIVFETQNVYLCFGLLSMGKLIKIVGAGNREH